MPANIFFQPTMQSIIWKLEIKLFVTDETATRPCLFVSQLTFVGASCCTFYLYFDTSWEVASQKINSTIVKQSSFIDKGILKLARVSDISKRIVFIQFFMKRGPHEKYIPDLRIFWLTVVFLCPFLFLFLFYFLWSLLVWKELYWPS